MCVWAYGQGTVDFPIQLIVMKELKIINRRDSASKCTEIKESQERLTDTTNMPPYAYDLNK